MENPDPSGHFVGGQRQSLVPAFQRVQRFAWQSQNRVVPKSFQFKVNSLDLSVLKLRYRLSLGRQ